MHSEPGITEQSALEALVATQEMTERHSKAIGRLSALVEAATTPATYEVHRLTAARPSVRDDVGDPSKSVGLYNPSTAVIYLAIGGGLARPNNDQWSVPPASALVLPFAAGDVEVGADPADLAAGDAVVFLVRFKTVQPLYLWGL